MSLEGLKFGALFSCRSEINDLFVADVSYEKLQRNLEQLPNYAWYKLIASVLQIADVFDKRVVEAYWLGDESIMPITVGQKEILVFHNFIILEGIRDGVPTIATNARDVDDCKISLGVVERIDGEDIKVEYDAMLFKEGKLYLQRQKAQIKKGFLQDVRHGDWVVFHVGIGRIKPTKEQAVALCQKTIDAVKLFNRAS